MLGLGAIIGTIACLRGAKIILLKNTLAKAKKRHLEMDDFNMVERQIPHLDFLVSLDQEYQIEVIELAIKFLMEVDIADWENFPGFVIENSSHELLRQICRLKMTPK